MDDITIEEKSLDAIERLTKLTDHMMTINLMLLDCHAENKKGISAARKKILELRVDCETQCTKLRASSDLLKDYKKENGKSTQVNRCTQKSIASTSMIISNVMDKCVDNEELKTLAQFVFNPN